MDPKSLQNGKPKPKEVRFKPVPRQRLIPKNIVIKSEVKDDDHKAGIALLKAYQADLEAKKSIKFERKVEPTTSQPYNASTSRSIGNRYQDSGYLYTPKVKLKEYVEPWDYSSHHPITHPIRRPFTGDPALLDKEEFGTERRELYEQPRDASYELGLMVEQHEPTFLRMQFPRFMPMIKQVADMETKKADEGSKPQAPCRPIPIICSLNELPAGHIGKMRVYKSGAVKLHIGDVGYNMSPGLECSFVQEFVSVNVADADHCTIQDVSKQAVITPDFDSIINKPLDNICTS